VAVILVPHQFVRHLAEPQLKVSAFIYILILIRYFLFCNKFSITRIKVLVLVSMLWNYLLYILTSALDYQKTHEFF
jgi:hypothetical protein